jgi:uncharacterized protein (TIGR03086 family)
VSRLADDLLDRFDLASAGFAERLREVRPPQWTGPTPCAEWDVRQLVNHMTRANLSYVRLLDGGSAAEFVRLRDADALGDDPVGAFAASARACAEAYARPGALSRVVDHPSGTMPGEQALAVRTADSAIHTWDLARAVGADERLDDALVAWIDEHLDEIYAGLPETPIAAGSTHRFFAAPAGVLGADASRQDRLLHLTGRAISQSPPG